jgi:hypothetical protein
MGRSEKKQGIVGCMDAGKKNVSDEEKAEYSSLML